MTWIPALLLMLATGWFLARASAGTLFGRANPLAAFVGEAGLAVLFGPGLASVLFFALSAAGLANPASLLGALAVLAAACGAVWWYTRPAEPVFAVERRGSSCFPWRWVLLLGLAAASLIVALDFSTASAANPNGEWDASAIWNLRARFLAGGADAWQRAISAEPGGFMARGSHPSYPLFLSSFLGILWTVAGTLTSTVPAAASGIIAFAVLALLSGSLAARKSLGLGLLAGLLLLGAELFASQSSAQYSDLLLALAVLAALVLLDAAEDESPRLLLAAGLAIGFAPWIKNEGVPFAIAALALAAWRFRLRGLIWILLGSAPGLLATTALKILAQGRETIFPGAAAETLAKLADPGRWWQSAAGFGNAFLQFGPWWAHPILLIAVIVWGLRLAPPENRRGRIWLWSPIVVMLAAEYGIFLVTTSDLAWHVGTAASRLVLQVWPSLIWLVFSMLRTPEEYYQAAAKTAAPAVSRRKRGRE